MVNSGTETARHLSSLERLECWHNLTDKTTSLAWETDDVHCHLKADIQEGLLNDCFGLLADIR
jgi:hypothetical protein